jgi:hypothetical protein
VRTADDKKTVEMKATDVAGAKNVTSQVSVAAQTSTSKKAGT